MKYSRIALLVSTLFALLLSACTASSLPQADLPPVSIDEPNIFARESIPLRSLVTVDDALACLASNRPVYGVTTANTNVRSTPTVDTCRIGRIPVGTTVKVDRAYDASGNPILRSTAAYVDHSDSSAIGYQEDIYPIFDRTCNSCHSGIVKNAGLQVTDYGALMSGSDKGAVVIPGDSAASLLWLMVDTGRMPMVGELSAPDKEKVRRWIDAGAPERRPLNQNSSSIWLNLEDPEIETVPDGCDPAQIGTLRLVSSDLVEPLSCGAPPPTSTVVTSLATLRSSGGTAPSSSSAARPQGSAALAVPYGGGADAAGAGIQAATLGLSAPSDSDLWLQPRGGFCIERRLPRNERSITALAFAPDGRLYLALDTPPLAEADPLILYDAYHPSRSIAVYDYVNDSGFQEIDQESPRITGLDHENGALYVSKSGEVGYIPDGGEYTPLAGGFAVNSQLFHANNGIEVSDGWVYVSAGGIRDGYSDGPLVDIGEEGAQSIVAGGNPYAARIVRAPLDRLLSERSITTFETAARGVRNPYGIARDPAGRIWFTDNGATNVPDEISAGDEVNIFNPASATGNDATAPYYGFPLALSGNPPDWYTEPAIGLPNASAPTGISWAYNTIFYAQYGRDPGLYRIGRAPNGQLAAERILLVWPLLAVETAPDGALWIGTGDGGLFRLTPGCQ